MEHLLSNDNIIGYVPARNKANLVWTDQLAQERPEPCHNNLGNDLIEGGT
jgi:hypothetical protein